MSLFFFFNDTATTEIYTLSLHDALPISTDFLVAPGKSSHFIFATEDGTISGWNGGPNAVLVVDNSNNGSADGDRKSTRLNSSHSQISYAVFCLKKKKI